jgi:hypothetical protein
VPWLAASIAGVCSAFQNNFIFRKLYLCSGIDPRSGWIPAHCQDFGAAPYPGHLPEASSFVVGISKGVALVTGFVGAGGLVGLSELIHVVIVVVPSGYHG